LAIGQKPLGKWAWKYATAIWPDKMKATGRVYKADQQENAAEEFKRACKPKLGRVGHMTARPHRKGKGKQFCASDQNEHQCGDDTQQGAQVRR
jgi:hypothetical protein